MHRLLIIPFFFLFVQCKKQVSIPDYENHRTSFLYSHYPGKTFDSTIKIITLNMHLGFKYTQDPWNKYETGGTDDHLKALAGILNEFDADIIALQEVPFNRTNTINKDYIEKLAKHLKMNVAFGSHGYNDPTGVYPVYGEWGNAILSKFQILEIKNIEVIRMSEWEKRSMLVASIKVNDQFTFELANIHYIQNSLIYQQQIDETKKHIQAPLVLCGDFNGIPGTKFDDIGLTDPDTSELLGIDKILISDDYFLCKNLISYFDTATHTSDHPYNLMELSIL